MNNLTHKKITNFVICLSVLGFSLVLAGTYSYFSKGDAYNVTGTVVNWSFSANDSTTSFTKNLTDIIPGDTGSFVVTLDATSATSDVECSIIPDVSNDFSGMILYADEDHTTLITVDNPLVQTVAEGTTSSANIYWVWEYDTGLLTGSSVNFTLNVVGRQVVS